MIMKYSQSSLADFIVRIMPEIDPRLVGRPGMMNPLAARNLFSLWQNKSLRLGDNVFQRPKTMAGSEVDQMRKADLVRIKGDKIEITSKGADVIKVMILGDDGSIFDKDKNLDYFSALAETKTPSVKTAKMSKSASNSWWERFE